MRDRFEELSGHGLAVLAIALAPPERLAPFRDELRLPFPVAADPERAAFRRFGLRRGSPWVIWHPRVLWKYMVMISRGARLARAGGGEDLAQLGGDFVIGADGRILLAHRSRRADDRPGIDALLGVLRATAATPASATARPVRS